MKVHLVKKQTIEDYGRNNARSRGSFRLWLLALREADWDRPKDILKTFGSADLLGQGSDRVVFDIGGNLYRMICHYAFGKRQVHLFICWIGTHAEYTKVCKEKMQYTIDNY
ncbi:MAG: type II toxin-antitoxin system HigB family toxin [Bacteroidota bacterium]|nr:type II toxin-antitoxin system HigB family toxin [Bacteroidota bacterium]MDP4216030.1 type II toxin-antitoxin system HigB family toxin [Bacteroidota bacterium]MDP4247478.1 type II toxin-antitoxin system HigB family toxin [Bacteroidota bacterium]